MNWIETTVGEYCPFVYGKSLPKTQRTEGDIPVFGSNGCVDYHNKSHVNGPGIIIGRKGSVGAVHLSVEPFWPIDTSFYVEKESIDELKFTYYLLKSLGLKGMNSDSAVPGLNRENAHALQIRIPEKIQDREKLGQWISVYDSKIELNRQTNQTLEQVAQAMFKSWFVDFDPVRAKIAANAAGENAQRAAMAAISGLSITPVQAQGLAAGAIADLDQLQQQHPEQYQQLQAIADLFPENLIESELGEIPEGWELTKLSTIIQFNPKRVLKKGSLAPYLDMKNVPTEGHLANEVILREMASGTKFINGDTLLARITPCLENGKTAYVDFLEDDQVGWGSTEYIVMRPKNGRPHSLGYILARYKSFRVRAIQTMTGTSGRQRANADALSDLTWLDYPIELLNIFDDFAGGYLTKAKANGDENKVLSQLRGGLLPKLLAGDIDINHDGGNAL